MHIVAKGDWDNFGKLQNSLAEVNHSTHAEMFPHWGVTEDFCPQHCKILWLKCITVHMLKCFLTGVTEFLSTKLQNSFAEVNHSMHAEVYPL